MRSLYLGKRSGSFDITLCETTVWLLQAVKIATAMGCEVTVFSTSDSKREEATKHLRAAHFVVSKDEGAMKVSTCYAPWCLGT